MIPILSDTFNSVNSPKVDYPPSEANKHIVCFCHHSK